MNSKKKIEKITIIWWTLDISDWWMSFGKKPRNDTYWIWPETLDILIWVYNHKLSGSPMIRET